MIYLLAAVLFTLSFIIFTAITYTIMYVYFRYKKSGVIPKNMTRTALFSGIILSALFSFGVMFWLVKQVEDSFNDSRTEFDETEYLKTHYKGVDCSSLVGQVYFGDYGISAEEACAGERTWYENNIELCKSSSCFIWMAVQTGDLEICKLQKIKSSVSMIDLRSLEGEQQVLEGCYEYVAAYRDDPAICDLISYTPYGAQECKEEATDGKTYLQFTNSPLRPYCLRRDNNGKCTF